MSKFNQHCGRHSKADLLNELADAVSQIANALSPPDRIEYETARKTVTDPDFDFGDVIIEIIARWIHINREHFDNHRFDGSIVQHHFDSAKDGRP